MENLKIRCRMCGKEIEGHPSRSVSCGCPNMATIRGDKISANDLSMVVMLNSVTANFKKNVLTNEDIMWQERRKQRQFKRLDFEIR